MFGFERDHYIKQQKLNQGAVLILLCTLLLASVQSFASYSDPFRNPMGANASFSPELERLGTKYGKETTVLKGTNKPYTGTSSSTISIWKDVVIKWSFVDGQEAVNPRTYYSQLTGEKLSGEFKTYYPDGAKHGVINLVDGKQVGTTKTWYPNGNLKSTFNYSMGIEDGVYSTFYENGNKKQTGIHGPNKTIQWTDWHINGQKESFNSFNGVGQPTFSKYWDLRGNPTKLPKEFRIHATDKDDTVATASKKNKGGNMEAFYVSIYVPLAIALFILLPLLGVGMCWLYRKVKKGNPQAS